MKKKRIISAILSIAMLISLFPTIIFADYHYDDSAVLTGVTNGDESTLPKISFDLFKDLTSKTPITTQEIVDSMDKAGNDGKSDSFFLGVKVTNFNKFVAMNKFGITTFYVPINYEPENIELEPNNRNRLNATTITTRVTNYSEDCILGYPIDATELSYASGYADAHQLSIASAKNNDTGKQQIQIQINPNSNDATTAGAMQPEEYVTFIELKIKAKPATPTRIFNFGTTQADNMTMGFGFGANGSSYVYNGTDKHLEYYLKLDDSATDFFPAGMKTQTGLKVKDSTTPTLTFIAEKAITDPIASIQKVFDSGDPEDVASTDVKYYYSATDKGAASFAAADLATGFTQVTLTNGIPKVENNFLYASDGKFAIKLGALTVNDATVDTITSVTATPGTVYNGDNVVFADGKFQVKGKLTNGKDYTYTTAAQLASSGLAFYKDSNCTVTDLGTYTVGANKATDTNTFYVAKTADKTKKKDVNVIVTYNNTVVTMSTAQKGAVTLKYNDGDTFAANTIKANFATLKAPSAAEKGFASFPSNVKVVFAASEAEAKTSTTYKDATSKVTASDIGKKIYIVTDNNGIKSAVEVGTLSQKAGDTTSITGNLTKTSYTYPETIDLSGLSFTITNTDDPSHNYNQSIAQAMTDGKIDAVEIVKGSATIASTDKLTYAQNGAVTLNFKKGGTVVASKQVTLTVNRKKLTVAFTGTVADRDYKGAADKTIGTPSITATATTDVSGDQASVPTVPAINYSFADGNVAYTGDTVTGKAITAAFATSAVTTNDKYELVLPTGGATGITGKINPKALDATVVTIVPQNKNATADLTLTDAATTISTSNKIGNDSVKITVSGTVAKELLAEAGEGKAITSPTFKIDNKNYKVGTITATATVTNRKLVSIEADATKLPADLRYGDTYPTTIDVTGNFTDADGSNPRTATVTADITAPAGGWKVGDNTVTVTYTEGETKTTTVTINVKPKKINLSDITFSATKQAGATEVTANNTIADGILIGDDVVTVKATTYIFDEGIVNDEQDITVSGITLDGDNAGNYVIVDAEGNPITAETTAQGKGTINQGTTEAPTAINTSVNSSNGSITVTEPVTAGDKKVEYSFDGGLTWTDDATKSDITPGTEYTIQARYKASEDGSTGASDVVTTTVKISQVRLFSVGDDSATAKPQQTFYTAGTEFAEKNITISRVTGTFTDKEGTTAVTFPLTLTSATTDLYVTVKRGGGGGGGSTSYTVKFSAGSHGKITEGKATTSVVLGAKLKATALPTITPDEGYRFIGWSADGETVVDPTTITVSKALSLTALYEEDKVEPTPTPTPLIKNNLKPYASGYDDGMFLPNDYITRAELASMIARLINGDDISNSYKASFADVDDTWYNKYIGYLEDKDVLSGYEDGTFRPNNSVTRGEMCAIIVRAQRYGLIPVDGMFTDVTDEDWAKTYITTLASMNIVSGYEDGTFGTYSPITRAETVAIINRVLEPSVPVITFTPLDIAGHWAEADIMLAVNERQLKNAVTEPTATPEATPEVTAEPTDAPETTPEATVEPTATPAA